MSPNLNALTWTVGLMLVIATAALWWATGCGGDDDDQSVGDGDDSGSQTDDDGPDDDGGDDDDTGDDDGDGFVCGEDFDCHVVYLECFADCTTLDCFDGCYDGYLACLDDDGCVEPQVLCSADCRGDFPDWSDPDYWNCLEGCDDAAVDCFGTECGISEACADDCLSTNRTCKQSCGEFEFGCLAECAGDLLDCEEECW